MIKTSAKTTSILAVAIAAIMVLCAVSGAIVYNNSTNNNNTTDSGDIPVSPIRPIDDPVVVTALPSSSSDLVTMLSKSGESENTLLVDRLANNNYTFNGATYSIKTNNDVAKYLYSLGYTIAGDNLAADIVGLDAQEATVATVDALTLSDEELAKMKAAAENDSNNYSLSVAEDDSSDIDDSAAAAKKRKKVVLTEAAEEEEAATSSFASLKDLTVRQFTSGSWLTDAENRPLAYYIYFMEFADKESTVLDAMTGTPFCLDGKLIRTVADAEDLAQMFYAAGYEVVGTSLVDNSLSLLANKSALAKTSNIRLANDNEYAISNTTPRLTGYAALGAVDSISGPFYELNDMTVELFLSNNYMMNEVRKAQMSSDLEISNELSNASSQKASVVAQYIYIECKRLIASATDSNVDATVALNLVLGTPFMTNDNKIAVITDADSFAQFFDSVGIVVKDGRAIFYTVQQDRLLSASVDGMNAEVAYVILAQKGCASRCISLEDIENAMETLAEAKKKAAEQKAADSQTTDVAAEEQASDDVEGADTDFAISSMQTFYDALQTVDPNVMMVEALHGYSFVDENNECVVLNCEDFDSYRALMAELGFEFDKDGLLVINNGLYDLAEMEIGKMISIIEELNLLDTNEEKNLEEIPAANEAPKEEVKRYDAFYNVEDLVVVLGYCDTPNETTAAAAIVGYIFEETEITDEEIAYECLGKLFEGNGKEYGVLSVSSLLEIIDAMASVTEDK